MGADLGGNGTVIGASANVVIVSLAARAGHSITFGGFLRYGIPVVALSLVVATVYLVVRYLI
jgi:Na+/H+ antiporter NhaD/arsenite permease-like protein